MGQWYYDKKATVEEACDLTVFQLKGYGMLERGLHAATVITWVERNSGKESRVGVEVNMIGEPYARITYAISDGQGNTTPYDSRIRLITSPCNLGGVRYWFVCPECGKRVGGLYLVLGRMHFRCRHCNKLTYRSRNRCKVEAWGHTSRQIKKLQSEIKRWTWRGLPTRRARRLYKLYGKMAVLNAHAAAKLEKFKGRFGR
jgi:hypothetical protein